MTTARAPDGAAPRIPEWVRLQVVLSCTALLVVILRAVQMAEIARVAGMEGRWPSIIATQGTFWMGWSLWAACLILLMRRLVERPGSALRRAGLVVLLLLAPLILVPLLYGTVHWLVFFRHTGPHDYLHSLTHDTVAHDGITNLLLSAAITGVAYGYLALQRARRLEVTAARLNSQLKSAELEALRSQLNPHFLFNALNSVAVLARRGKGAEVEKMVSQLAGLLRHSLESSRAQLVTLRVELEALNEYLGIEQVRFGDRLAVTVDVPETLLGRVVPSLLLQPLAENAIRHGFTDGSTPLHLVIRGRAEAGRLVLAVVDDGPGPMSGPNPPEGLGLGLGNTRARLEGLYNGAASLSLGPAEGGRGARVTVVLPDGPA